MFRAIGKAIVFIVDGIAKICALILLTFGMFVPMLYTIGFFVCKIIFKFQFTSIVSLIFFVGLSVSVLGGLYFAFCRLRKRISRGKNLEHKSKILKRDIVASKKDDKKRSACQYAIKDNSIKPLENDGFDYSPSQQPKNRKSDRYENVVSQQTNDIGQPQAYAPPPQYGQPQAYAPPPQYGQPQAYAPPPQYGQPQAYAPPPQYGQPQQQNAPSQDDAPQQNMQNQKYSEFQRMQLERKYGSDSAKQPEPELKETSQHMLTAEAEKLLSRLEGNKNEETPLIFKIKNSPDTFVYEFIDRLQFFKKQGNKMILIKTQYKKSTGEIKR